MSYRNLHMSLHYLAELLCSKIVHYIAPKKGATRFLPIFQIILHLIFLIFGMLHRKGPSMQVGNLIFFLLTWQCCDPTWITQS